MLMSACLALVSATSVVLSLFDVKKDETLK
jgi:hypothetical protein